jgi:hypothetical protein
VAIGVFTGATFILWRLGNALWWILAIVAGHFFLFCNVFRITRRRELIWGGLFLLNMGVWAWSGHLTWIHVLPCQFPITAWLIFAGVREPGYHGVLANRLNRRLNDYLEGRIP